MAARFFSIVEMLVECSKDSYYFGSELLLSFFHEILPSLNLNLI